MVENFCLSTLVLFSHISQITDAVKQVNSGEEAAIALASVSLNLELSNSIESRDEIPESGWSKWAKMPHLL